MRSTSRFAIQSPLPDTTLTALAGSPPQSGSCTVATNCATAPTTAADPPSRSCDEVVMSGRYASTVIPRIDESPDLAARAPKFREIPMPMPRWGWDHLPMAWTVLIVDDHAGFRGFARRLLEAEGFTVVGEAADGMSALAAVDALKPEVVLLDIVLPDTDGLAIATALAQRANAPAVVLTSSRERADFGRRLEQAPAKGFLHKDDLSGRALVSLVSEHRVRS